MFFSLFSPGWLCLFFFFFTDPHSVEFAWREREKKLIFRPNEINVFTIGDWIEFKWKRLLANFVEYSLFLPILSANRLLFYPYFFLSCTHTFTITHWDTHENSSIIISFIHIIFRISLLKQYFIALYICNERNSTFGMWSVASVIVIQTIYILKMDAIFQWNSSDRYVHLSCVRYLCTVF